MYYLVYGLELFLVGEEIFHNRVKDKKRYVIFAIIYLGILLSVLLLNGKVEIYITAPMYLFMYLYLFMLQRKILPQIFHLIVISAFTGIIEILVSAITRFLFSGRLDTFLIIDGWFLNLLITAIFCIWLVKRKWTKKVIRYFSALKWYQNMIIVVMIVIAAFFITLTKINLDYVNDNREAEVTLHLITTIMIAIILIGIIWLAYIVYSKEYYFSQSKQKEEMIGMQEQFYKDIYKSEEEMCRFRHDIRSQLSTPMLLLGEGKIEEAKEHLKEMTQSLENLIVYKYHTGNSILDIIVNREYGAAKEKGVNISLSGKMETIDVLNSYDLCAIVSNALENGVEACEKNQNEERMVRMSILEGNQRIMFHFKNPATREMYEAAVQGRTTKPDKKYHGYGVGNIRMAVERNGGKMEYRYEEGKLVLEIIFEK